MAERLYGFAREMSSLGGSERVFDLFCRIGTLGLTLATEAGEVWGIELVEEAVAAAEANA
jgi:23S rRNA (uracil1939-C5)-methyltransferase